MRDIDEIFRDARLNMEFNRPSKYTEFYPIAVLEGACKIMLDHYTETELNTVVKAITQTTKQRREQDG